MRVCNQWWRNPLRPWRVDVPERYKLCQTSRFGMEPDDPWYEFDTRIAYWLDNLVPVRVAGKEYPAASYLMRTARFKPAVMAHMGMTKIGGMTPPPIWFARKSHVLMFKLTWGGNV